jgi:hypothetical protein
MARAQKSADFFVVGGTLGLEADSYVRRPADEQLLDLLMAGEYCNVLAPRQVGKSSLMVRTAESLEKQGVRAVVIDLTSIGSQVTDEQWYIGLISFLIRRLKLHADEHEWWNARKEKSPVQRFNDFLHEVLLTEIQEPVVIFVDEIDSTLKLDFTDDFFAAIRAEYNARAQDANLRRLTFVLLGVARPADLIKDRTRTSYNIGAAIDITDFRLEELGNFEAILEHVYPGQGRQILEWVLVWTGGQPYLTQKLCAELVKQVRQESVTQEELDHLVERLFLGDMAHSETNLKSIQEQVRNNPHLTGMLKIYKRVVSGREVPVEDQSIEQNELKLAGLVGTTPRDTLQVRNQIYAHIFDRKWTEKLESKDRNSIGLTISIALSTLSLLITFSTIWLSQYTVPEMKARAYAALFQRGSIPAAQIHGLAGLLRLGDGFADQAQEMFASLDQEQKIALLTTAPPYLKSDMVVLVGGVYQAVENTSQGNALLETMADFIDKTDVPGSDPLALEIQTWLQARQAAAKHDPIRAIDDYSEALRVSTARGQPNMALLEERAVLYGELEQYDKVLEDYEQVLEDRGFLSTENDTFSNPALQNYWQERSASYPYLGWYLGRRELNSIDGYLGEPSSVQYRLNLQRPEEMARVKLELVSDQPGVVSIEGPTFEPSSDTVSLWTWKVTPNEIGSKSLTLRLSSLTRVGNQQEWQLRSITRYSLEVTGDGWNPLPVLIISVIIAVLGVFIVLTSLYDQQRRNGPRKSPGAK